MAHPKSESDDDDLELADALKGLRGGDFSRLEPFFTAGPGGATGPPRIIRWHREGRFRTEPGASAEALTCACFLGRTDVAEYLLEEGIDPQGGAGTGMDALHWAANRGQLESVRLLLRRKASLETRSLYGATALGTAVWSALHEPRPDQLRIIEELLQAGARVDEISYPTGNEPAGNQAVDAVLRLISRRR